jgi:hypothetical protein
MDCGLGWDDLVAAGFRRKALADFSLFRPPLECEAWAFVETVSAKSVKEIGVFASRENLHVSV